jgi:hypothetical protein
VWLPTQIAVNLACDRLHAHHYLFSAMRKITMQHNAIAICVCIMYSVANAFSTCVLCILYVAMAMQNYNNVGVFLVSYDKKHFVVLLHSYIIMIGCKRVPTMPLCCHN